MARFAIYGTCVRVAAIAGLAVLSPGETACAGEAPETVIAAFAKPIADGNPDGNPDGSPDSTETTSWHQKTSVDAEPAGENWIGADGFRRAASLYSGVTWAPLGNLRQDGPRLRLIAGQSIYSYAGGDFIGQGRFLDLLAGWQLSKDATTIKVFAGASRVNNLIAPYDPSTKIQGRAQGVKAVLELWHNWTPRHWTSLDLSFANTHATGTAQLRTGWRLPEPAWSVGPEVSLITYADRNFNVGTETVTPRTGVFVRFENLAYEFTISGGVARTFTMPASYPVTWAAPMAYGTAQYLRRF